jgi:hypothetical protein
VKNTPVAVFEELARHTWSRLADGHAFGVRQGEVSISDYLLLEMARERLPTIHILKTPAHLERLKGTDWEWWIGSRANGWLRYAVQAKRLQYPSDYYDQLGHRVRKRLQVDLLTEYARANKAIAMYALYNSTRDANASRFWNCNLPFEKEQLGCTVVSAGVVSKSVKTRGGRTLQYLHTGTGALPWRCLVRCPLILSAYTANSSPGPATSPLFENQMVTVHRVLPPLFDAAIETGELESLDTEFFSPDVGMYPYRIAIIDIGEAVQSGERSCAVRAV